MIDLTKLIEIKAHVHHIKLSKIEIAEFNVFLEKNLWVNRPDTIEAYRRLFEASPRMLVRLKKDEIELRHHVENPCDDSTPGEYKYEKAAIRQRERDDLAELVALISEIEGTPGVKPVGPPKLMVSEIPDLSPVILKMANAAQREIIEKLTVAQAEAYLRGECKWRVEKTDTGKVRVSLDFEGTL